MTNHPTGTVTFLLTDIEGSTKLWQEHPDQMKANLAKHDGLLRQTNELLGWKRLIHAAKPLSKFQL